MPAPKPVVIKIRGGYKITIGPYTTMVRVGQRGPGTLVLNVETFLGREEVAHINGTRSGEIAKFYHAGFSKGLSKPSGLKALGVLFPCLEIALRKVGIENISGRTHPTFAKFLGKMGWKVVGRGGTAWDVEKDLLKIKPKFLFKIKPLARKTKKKKAPRRPRRRL